MPDSVEESIRRLIKSPAEEPLPLDQDGGRTRVVPKELFARWYENAGGIDNAIEQAQLAMAERSLAKEDPEYPFRTWTVADITRPISASYAITRQQGSYTPQRPGPLGYLDTPHIEISDDFKVSPASVRSVLDHEAGHGYLIGKVMKGKDSPLDGGETPADLDRKMFSYFRQPTDIDTRLAGIKRRYAHNFGKIPQTHEDAEGAIKWFIDNWQQPAGTDDPNHNDYNAANIYLELPEHEKKRVLQRMLEVVDGGRTDELIDRLGRQS